MDLGAGVGVIGLLLARRHPTVRVVGVELDRERARHAAANARANGLARRCLFIRGDLRAGPRFLPPEHFDRIVANPPYRRVGSGATSPDRGRASARHDATFGLDDLAAAAAALLRFGGTLDLIHLPERLPELWRALAARRLEPKRLRLIVPFDGAAPRLCLVSATKGGQPGLAVQPQLVLHRPGGGLAAEAAKLAAAARAEFPQNGKKLAPGK